MMRIHRIVGDKSLPSVLKFSLVGILLAASSNDNREVRGNSGVSVEAFTSTTHFPIGPKIITTTPTRTLTESSVVSKGIIKKVVRSPILVDQASQAIVQTKSVASSVPSSLSSTTRLDMSITNSDAKGSSSSTIRSGETAFTWVELQQIVGQTVVGKALNNEVQLRQQGNGSAHVQNKLRLFGHNYERDEDEPQITLFRDHAGWCPYCQKTMLLIEEKQIPIKIELVPMRSYGDKPREFLQKVPSGLLPAIEVNGRVITESQVIMELLDKWHTVEDGYRPMMPKESDEAGRSKYMYLARLERELFSWWCTLVFRPEGPRLGGSGGNPLKSLFGGSPDPGMSPSMKGFMDCIRTVDENLRKTKGPWFMDEHDYPTMIDFVYVSHVERMLASCAYWKGLDLRDPKWNLVGLNRWLEAFEKREAYLAFKSDYYTHVKDIPPQYGPGYDGGFDSDRIRMSRCILGLDGSWTLPLSHDDPLQPLYNGPPLPICVLESVGLRPPVEADGSYRDCDASVMALACRTMAGWKLASNGANVAAFAARGGPGGAKNPRKSFGAELADPYAKPDEQVLPAVDAALRVVCAALIAPSNDSNNGLPSDEYKELLKATVVGSDQVKRVVPCLMYVRDRVGVPRDLPLAAARYLRAYLNWAIDTLLE